MRGVEPTDAHGGRDPFEESPIRVTTDCVRHIVVGMMQRVREGICQTKWLEQIATWIDRVTNTK